MSNHKKSLQQLHPKRLDIVFLILASAVLLFIGLHLPVLTVRKLWERNTFSILSGIANLWNERYYFLAVVIFFFSIVFPIVKLTTLFATWFLKLTDSQRNWILYCLSILGKWSMLDVFVTAIIIVTVKLGALATAKAEKGIYYFGASILLAMTATVLQNLLAKRSKAS